VAFFFLRFFLLSLFISIFLFREFKQRRALGSSPKNLRELFDLGAKWKRGSNPKVSALLFAFSSFLGFALWESLFISILDIFPYLIISLPLGVISAALLLRRRLNFHDWSFQESIWAAFTLGALSGALFTWVFLPWIFYRAKYLKKV
jgi:hypothetical protein